MHVLGTQKTFK